MDKQDTPEPLPALPPSAPPGQEEAAAAPAGDGGRDEVRTITVDGMGIKLDHLGPIIVNTDGTLTRIANWAALTEQERQVALRRIAKRNRERREQLEQQQGQQGPG